MHCNLWSYSKHTIQCWFLAMWIICLTLNTRNGALNFFDPLKFYNIIIHVEAHLFCMFKGNPFILYVQRKPILFGTSYESIWTRLRFVNNLGLYNGYLLFIIFVYYDFINFWWKRPKWVHVITPSWIVWTLECLQSLVFMSLIELFWLHIFVI